MEQTPEEDGRSWCPNGKMALNIRKDILCLKTVRKKDKIDEEIKTFKVVGSNN